MKTKTELQKLDEATDKALDARLEALDNLAAAVVVLRLTDHSDEDHDTLEMAIEAFMEAEFAYSDAIEAWGKQKELEEGPTKPVLKA